MRERGHFIVGDSDKEDDGKCNNDHVEEYNWHNSFLSGHRTWDIIASRW